MLMQNEAICPRIVASAAPVIPISSTKMNSGSRAVLISAPMSIDIME